MAAEVGVLEAGEACERRRALEAGEAGERRRALEAGDRLRAVVAADMQIVLPRVVIAIGMGRMGEKNARNEQILLRDSPRLSCRYHVPLRL